MGSWSPRSALQLWRRAASALPVPTALWLGWRGHKGSGGQRVRAGAGSVPRALPEPCTAGEELHGRWEPCNHVSLRVIL